MKNLIKSFATILLMSSSLLSSAQFTVGLLIFPIAEATSTRVLASIGTEFKFANKVSLITEYGIPFINTSINEFKEKAMSFSAEVRIYKSTPIQKGFKQYFAIKLKHRPESYGLIQKGTQN